MRGGSCKVLPGWESGSGREIPYFVLQVLVRARREEHLDHGRVTFRSTADQGRPSVLLGRQREGAEAVRRRRAGCIVVTMFPG